jgi:hypothetical protein
VTEAADRAAERALVGTYRVLSMESTTDDGEVERQFGERPEGFITYTPEGYMMALLSRPDRAPFVDGDILGGRPEEQIAAFVSASAFAGRYEVVDGRIAHHLEAASFPNWKGTTQVREYELTATHLVLKPPRLLMNGKWRTSRVDLERLPLRT